MTEMQKYVKDKAMLNFLYEICQGQNIDLEKELSEKEVDELVEYGLSILDRLSLFDTDKDKMEYLFEGLMLYATCNYIK